MHLAILRAHMTRRGEAILSEFACDYGWLDDHVHEIVMPLTANGPAPPSPVVGSMPLVTNSDHGQWPGENGARWLYAKIYAHPERHDSLVVEHLPKPTDALGEDADYWFIRYRTSHETDHIRLRLRVPVAGQYGTCATAVGNWARKLRDRGAVSRLVLDSYQPELGRYGCGATMDSAEAVFVADSKAVTAGLRHLVPSVIHPIALAVASMVEIATHLLGDDQAMTWLASRPASGGIDVDRAVVDQAVRLAQPGVLPGQSWPDEVATAWLDRAASLSVYAKQIPTFADVETVLESLLHMHHNRAIGVDQESERACSRLARQSAFAWRARRSGTPS